MWYVGLDVHSKTSTFCVLDENGKKVFTKTVKGPKTKVIEELRIVKEKNGKKMSVCYEASDSYGYVYDMLKEIMDDVQVAHPGQLRLIFRSKRKSDRVDAEKLAQLLFLDQVPPVYVPSRDVREWRTMIKYRSRAIKKRTRVKNEIRAFVRDCGLEAPQGLWTAAGRDWLESIEGLSVYGRSRRAVMLNELDHHEQNIKDLEKLLNRIASRHPGCMLLRSTPGIGPRTSEALVAYIDDTDRFSSVDQVAAYFGLVPCLDSSAGNDRQGHITREGPAIVRQLLTEAAWISIRKSPKIRARYERIAGDDPDRKKIAIIAVAHFLCRASFSMLKNGQSWKEKE